MTTENHEETGSGSKLATRLYLVTHKGSGERCLVDTYHPSKAAAIATAQQYKVAKPTSMEVVKLVQSGVPVLTNKEY